MRSRNWRAYALNVSTYRLWPSAYSVSNTRLDLPEPLGPVTTVISPVRRSRSRFFRLCWRAPRMRISPRDELVDGSSLEVASSTSMTASDRFAAELIQEGLSNRERSILGMPPTCLCRRPNTHLARRPPCRARPFFTLRPHRHPRALVSYIQLRMPRVSRCAVVFYAWFNRYGVGSRRSTQARDGALYRGLMRCGHGAC